jgi:hypothetical protein
MGHLNISFVSSARPEDEEGAIIIAEAGENAVDSYRPGEYVKCRRDQLTRSQSGARRALE